MQNKDHVAAKNTTTLQFTDPYHGTTKRENVS